MRADRDMFYTESEIAEWLEKAASLGFSMEPGSELEKLTTEELRILVSVIQ